MLQIPQFLSLLWNSFLLILFIRAVLKIYWGSIKIVFSATIWVSFVRNLAILMPECCSFNASILPYIAPADIAEDLCTEARMLLVSLLVKFTSHHVIASSVHLNQFVLLKCVPFVTIIGPDRHLMIKFLHWRFSPPDIPTPSIQEASGLCRRMSNWWPSIPRCHCLSIGQWCDAYNIAFRKVHVAYWPHYKFTRLFFSALNELDI